MVLFYSFYYIVVMLLTYQHNKILMRAKPRALVVVLYVFTFNIQILYALHFQNLDYAMLKS